MHRRLLIRPGAIGDCILALPELEAARTDYTEVWAPRSVLPLIRFADRTRAIADTGLDRVGVLPGAQVPALHSFDSIYSWYGTQHSEFRDAVRHLPFTFFPALPPSAQGVPRIPVPSATAGDFAVIHPFSGGPKKNWALENFRALASRLPLTVKWSAGPDELLDNAVRFDDLYELGCWLSTARVYVGNDSGISHLAAAVGTPVVAIFTCTDPRIWAPRGAHVIVLENPSLEEACRAVHLVLDRDDGFRPRERAGRLLQRS
jgi:lipopolysaccharide heptosyltransferase III